MALGTGSTASSGTGYSAALGIDRVFGDQAGLHVGGGLAYINYGLNSDASHSSIPLNISVDGAGPLLYAHYILAKSESWELRLKSAATYLFLDTGGTVLFNETEGTKKNGGRSVATNASISYVTRIETVENTDLQLDAGHRLSSNDFDDPAIAHAVDQSMYLKAVFGSDRLIKTNMVNSVSLYVSSGVEFPLNHLKYGLISSTQNSPISPNFIYEYSVGSFVKINDDCSLVLEFKGSDARGLSEKGGLLSFRYSYDRSR